MPTSPWPRRGMSRLPILLLVVTLAAASCGGDDGGPGVGPDGGGAMTAMLGLVPDTEDSRRLVVINDYAAAADAFGLERPGADADEETLLGHRFDLVQESGIDGSAISGWTRMSDPEAWRTELGFVPTDVTRDVTAGTEPEVVQALVGRFDRDAVEAAVESDPAWRDILETAEHDGTEYWLWGEDGDRNRARTSPVRMGGESARMALVDGTLLWTRTTPAMERLIEAAGGGPSLADDDAFSAIGAELDDAGVYAAVLSDEAIDPDDDPRSTPAQQALAGPALGPYVAYGSGAAVDGDDRLMVLVVAHADDAAAEDNVERLRTVVEEGRSQSTRRPWRDVVEIADLRADGRLVVAVFKVEEPDLWATHVFQRDSLLATE